MAVALLSTAMISTCISNLLVTKLTSQAGSTLYNYLFTKKKSSSSIQIDEYIRQIDIKEKITISKAFMESISTSNFKFKSILTSMEDLIIEIEALLLLIEKKKNKHTQKYFSSYRKLSLRKEQDKLLAYDTILSKRLDYLIKLISVS